MGEIQKAAEAPAQLTPQQAIKQALDNYRPVFAKLLKASNIDEGTFEAQIANACRSTPDLWLCEPATVLGAALKAAQLGLAPNDGTNLAWIIPYRRGDVRQAQFQLGYGGVMELARRAVPGLRFDGRPVYPNDEFDVDYGRDQPLIHRPYIVTDHRDRGGDAVAWYVRAIFPDGSSQIHLLDKQGVEYHRSFSKMKNSPMWEKSYDAAALKSVVVDMKRWLPASPQLTAALASDEQVLTPEQAIDDDVIEVESEEVDES